MVRAGVPHESMCLYTPRSGMQPAPAGMGHSWACGQPGRAIPGLLEAMKGLSVVLPGLFPLSSLPVALPPPGDLCQSMWSPPHNSIP